MKRLFLLILLSCAVEIFGDDPVAAPVNPVKSFIFTPDMVEAKAGEVVECSLKITAREGFVVDGYDVKILRKDAPKAFFDIPNLKIVKHAHKNYDSFVVKPYSRFTERKSTAEVALKINTAGYKEGDYAILAVGSYLDKNNRRYYAGGQFFLTISAGDNSSIVPGGAAPMVEYIKLTPGKIELQANSTLPEIKLDFQVDPAKKIRLYSCFITRVWGPEAFFAANAAKVIKNPANSKADRIEVQGNRAVTVSGGKGSAVIKNDSLRLVPGEYSFIVQLYGHDAAGKGFYRTKLLPVSVK
ncbi:MAG: hypothetical protein E7052_02670 [Lentisphaerae bacterium]|nr:hypothetical protein [Lentisphaerota bacterium]